MLKRLTARKAGFTLMEMLVVIAIMTIVASIVVPAIFNARKKARLAECMSNLKQIGISLQMYAQSNGDRYPIWPDPSRPEFTDGGLNYALDATNVLQWSAADSPDLVNEKIALGCLYPEFLGDDRVLNDPADPAHRLTAEARLLLRARRLRARDDQRSHRTGLAGVQHRRARSLVRQGRR